MLRCKLITAPGECIEALNIEYAPEGYTYEVFPSDQSAQGLVDTYDQADTESWLRTKVAVADMAYARALRSSWAALLEASTDDDEYTVFGESDAVPTLPASQVKELVDVIFKAHPKVDVIRLFCNQLAEPHVPGSNVEYTVWNVGKDHSKYTNDVFGTHALIIRKKARARLASYLRTVCMPSDTLLEWMASRGLLEVVTLKSNVFYQHTRTAKADKSTLFSFKYRKFALLMSSYKRPSDLLRQIYAMMDQNYPREMYHMYVAVKGMDDVTLNSLIKPVLHFVKEGRLTITRAANSDQFTNLLDTIKNVPDEVLQSYDKFFKIDDDDFYSRDYLAKVNSFYVHMSSDLSTNARGMLTGVMRTVGLSNPIVTAVKGTFYGGTLVFPYSVLQEFKRCKLDRSVFEKYAQRIPTSQERPGYTEDGILDTIMLDQGYSPLSRIIGTDNWCVILNTSNTSITRGGLVPKQLYTEGFLTHPEVYSLEDMFALKGLSHGIFYLYTFNSKGHAVYGGRTGTCEFEKEGSDIRVKWDDTQTQELYRFNQSTLLYEQVLSAIESSETKKSDDILQVEDYS